MNTETIFEDDVCSALIDKNQSIVVVELNKSIVLTRLFVYARRLAFKLESLSARTMLIDLQPLSDTHPIFMRRLYVYWLPWVISTGISKIAIVVNQLFLEELRSRYPASLGFVAPNDPNIRFYLKRDEGIKWLRSDPYLDLMQLLAL